MIDKIVICKKCRAHFLFQDDMESHEQATGHKEMFALPL
jgi:hypothetical protein